MQSITPPIGGGKGKGKQPRTIEEFNRHMHNEYRRLKGLPLDYERGKEGKNDEEERTEAGQNS